MNEGLELIIKELKRTLEKYPTCDECDIRHTCAKVGNKSGLYICEMLKEIDDGDYQGTLLYLIPEDTYQPNSSEYLMTFVEYGSCSGCDTLQGIQCFLDTKSRDKSIDDLMNLCKDLICNMIKPYNTGWRHDEKFDTIEIK